MRRRLSAVAAGTALLNRFRENRCAGLDSVYIKSGSLDVEVTWGVCTVQGRRAYQEDRSCIETLRTRDRGLHCFGVFDGHGGAAASEFCAKRLPRILRECSTGRATTVEVLRTTFSRVEEEFSGAVGRKSMIAGRADRSGTTAVVAIVEEGQIIVANLGDSRAVLCKGGVAYPLSIDHKPSGPQERERIELAGGQVLKVGPVHRVFTKEGEGGLAVARSIGDYYLKDVSPEALISAKPEIKSEKLSFSMSAKDRNMLLILASDGVWDVMSNQMACNIASQVSQDFERSSGSLSEPKNLAAAISDKLVNEALSRGSEDNATALVVMLRPIENNTLNSADVLLAQLNHKMQELESSVQDSQGNSESAVEEHSAHGRQASRRRRWRNGEG